MAHLHSVYDGDTHFKIIPVSRKIENTTGKVILMQNDHNSERFTFEIPRYIEGHDMSICNKVEVHYNNTDTKTKDVNKDVYEATDLQVSPNSEDVVICSWLISGNATKYAGSLYFVLRFACLTDSTIDYQWFTDIYKDITISKSIFNTETVAIDNSDILEQWKAELEALYGGGGVAEPVVNEKIGAAKEELIGNADDLTDADTIHASKNLARGLVNGLESKVVKTTELNNAIDSALLQAKESGEFDGANGDDGLSAYEIWLQQGNTGTKADFLESLKGKDGKSVTVSSVEESTADGGENVVTFSNGQTLKVKNGSRGSTGATGADGYTPVKGTDYWTEADKAEIVEEIAEDEAFADGVAEIVKAEVPLVKTAEQPTFVDSVDEMTDTSKAYVLSTDGYFYRYREVENYNLLKLSEVSYSSRLQNDIEGIVSSTNSNFVTGIIPVKYGKYYALSMPYFGTDENWVGKRTTGLYPNVNPENTFIYRINAIKSDGTVIVYGNTWMQNVNGLHVNVEHGAVITIPNPDIEFIQLHINCYKKSGESADVSTPEKLSAIEYMLVEGDTAQEAYDKAVNNAYIDGDAETIVEWYNTGLRYNQPASYEERVVKLEASVTELENETEAIKNNIANPTTASPYYRKVNWGCVPNEYFRGKCDSYSTEGFTNNTQYADYIAKFKALLTGHEAYVTETELGDASDGQMIYGYKFKPIRWDNEMIGIPKIIIVAGQHGTERCNVFGLYYFIKDLLNNWVSSPALEYLRHHVELIVVPVVNTYGFDNRQYKNANGVNINRNYSAKKWVPVEDTESPQYGGVEPFDQPESRIIRDLVLANSDCVLLIDSHTNSDGNTESWEKLGYYGINVVNDDYFNRIRNALPELVSKISPNFNVDYDLNAPNTMFGFLAVGGKNGILRTWGCENNILSVLIEGFAGFLEGEPVSADIFKANEEQMVNWLITAVNYLSK